MSFAAHPRDFEAFDITESPSSQRTETVKGRPLTNRVHRIWSYRRFSQKVLYRLLPEEVTSHISLSTLENAKYDTVVPPLPREAYDRMRPALQLATILLKKSLYFLYIVRNAKIATSSTARGQPPGGTRRHFVKLAPESFSSRHERIILAQLQDLADRMYFIGECTSKSMVCIAQTMSHRRRLTRKRKRTGGANDETTLTDTKRRHRTMRCKGNVSAVEQTSPLLPLCVPQNGSGRLGSVDATTSPTSPRRTRRIKSRQTTSLSLNIITCVSNEAIVLLTPPSDPYNSETPDVWPMLPQAAQLRVLFSLAVTLVHELVHALFYDRWLDGCAEEEEEVYFDVEHDVQNELGFAWERWMFGGILHPLDGEMDGDGDRTLVERNVGLSKPDPGGINRRVTRSSMLKEEKSHRVKVTLPTYGIAWKIWRHTKSVGVRPGKDCRLIWYLHKDQAIQWFDRDILNRWLKAAPRPPPPRNSSGTTGPNNQQPSSISIDAPAIHLTPLVTRYGGLYWRGAGLEHRNRPSREAAWDEFDAFLDRVYQAGCRIDNDHDHHRHLLARTTNTFFRPDAWAFDWLSEYSDTSPPPPAHPDRDTWPPVALATSRRNNYADEYVGSGEIGDPSSSSPLPPSPPQATMSESNDRAMISSSSPLSRRRKKRKVTGRKSWGKGGNNLLTDNMGKGFVLGRPPLGKNRLKKK